MKQLFLFLAIIGCYRLSAQQKLPDFGKINIADLQMKECAFDKTADAMVLFNVEDVAFSIGYFTGVPYLKTERRVRIKIFTEKGFGAGNVIIPYISRGKSSKISDVDAVIYNLDDNGNIVIQKLDSDEIFKDRAKGKISINSVSFTFPNLKKGSVIEYRYTKNEKSAAITPWIYQDRYPTLYSYCNIKIAGPAGLAYKNVATQAVEKDSVIKTYTHFMDNDQRWHFAMRNVPGFKTEPLMTALKDNVQRTEFALSPDVGFIHFRDPELKWNMYNSSLISSRYFGKQFDRPLEGTRVFINTVLQLQNDVDKIEAVYNYVKGSLSWNGEQIFLSDSLEECWHNKTGSSAEMNMVLLNLLRQANIYAYPILISTRDNGMPQPDFPSLGQFNGMDVLAFDESNRPYFLDCSKKEFSFRVTPVDILSSKAYLVDRSKNQWIEIVDNRPLFGSATDAEITVDSTILMHGVVKATYINVARVEASIEREQEEEKSRGAISKNTSISLIENGLNDLQVDTTAEDYDNDIDTLVKTTKFHTSLEYAGNLYFINPSMFTMFRNNPFTDCSRLYDIDFRCNQEYSSKILFTVAGNIAIDELPKTTSTIMADSSITFNREFFNSNSQIVARYSFKINKALFSPSEYPALKSFFTKVYALLNEQIVLKKKNE